MTSDFTFKAVLLGSSGVGKTTLLRTLAEGHYCEEQVSTIGAELTQKTLLLGNHVRVNLQLWDTAGQDRLRIVSKNYFRNPNAVLFCFDLTDPPSFHRIREWILSAKDEAGPQVIRVLVGTKADRLDQLVSESSANHLAKEYGMQYCAVSAKTGLNVQLLFESLGLAIYEGLDREKLLELKAPGRLPRKQEGRSCFCC